VDEVVSIGQGLFERLLVPLLLEAGEGVEQLVIVPSALLAKLPFEALVVGTKGDTPPQNFEAVEFVLDRYEVCYGSSTPVLVELAKLGPRPTRGKVLLLADPLYPSETPPQETTATKGEAEAVPSLLGGPRDLPDPRRLYRLPWTQREALGIADLFKVAEVGEVQRQTLDRLRREEIRSASLTSPLLDLYIGAEASPKRLHSDLKPYAIVHIAAHGYLDAEQPQRSGLALSFGEKEEGYVTIRDMLDLDLDANAVVLSACQTAVGELKRGEGVQSMARAFLYAGSRSVIASLWQVRDHIAMEVMTGLYRRALAERPLPLPRALHDAKLSVRRSHEVRGPTVKRLEGEAEAVVAAGHPYFWAPFIDIGLPR
jgi:CHAT domain-containing protein